MSSRSADKAWVHRIDAVPAPRRRIEFRRDDEPSRTGWVTEARDDFYAGIGDEVRIDDGTGPLLIPSKTYTQWRYIAEN